MKEVSWSYEILLLGPSLGVNLGWLGCFKINNFEKLKFLQILEFCQLFSTSSFSFYAVSVTKSYPMHKIKCVGNEILLHLKYFKVLKRGFLTKLGGLTWPLNEKVKISFFDEQLGHLDGWFLAKKHPYGTKQNLIPLSCGV